jgi:hypothetical protein
MERLVERMTALESTVEELRAQRQVLQERERSAHRRLRLWQGVAGALVVAGLLLAPTGGVIAQGQQGGVPVLAARVTTLETTVATLQTQAGNLQSALNTEIATRQAADTALQNNLNAEAAARAAADANLQNQVTPLTTLFLAPNGVNGQPFFQRAGAEITITGANLHIVNGLGATNGNPSDPYLDDTGVINGLGNLIIGYNELRGANDDRSGSHNLVLGIEQNYRRFGGFVAGSINTISGPYASVTGGAFNTATGNVATVDGGVQNTADGIGAAVSGGTSNAASGLYASVSGGINNNATGDYSSVSGGDQRSAAGRFSWAAGGCSRALEPCWLTPEWPAAHGPEHPSKESPPPEESTKSRLRVS